MREEHSVLIQWTMEDMDRAIALLKPHVEAELVRTGSIRPITYLFGVRDPQEEQTARTIVPFPTLNSFDNRGKNIYASQVREMAKRIEAKGSIFISEIWTMSTVRKPGEKIPRRAKDLAKDPRAIEKIMFLIEHKPTSSQRQIFATIRRNPNGEPTLEEWIETNLNGVPIAGRFMGMLNDA